MMHVMVVDFGFRRVIRYVPLIAGLVLVGGGLAVTAVAKGCAIFAGGVAGVADLTVPGHSIAFRADGGGLYLHNNGWAKLDQAQRLRVLNIFSNAPVAVELGFGGSPRSAKAWAEAWRRSYGTYGIQPTFIAANAFASNYHPTPEQWSAYMVALRKEGVPAKTLILPTFEYQNFRANIATLSQCVVSRQKVFQAIIRSARGMVLDTPPGYFFSREQNYRDWVVDAIHWTRKQGLKTVVIVSPHTSRNNFAADALRFLKYLRNHDAVPDIVAVENYKASAPADYPNVVGAENRPNSVLGVARMLQLKIESR